MTRTSYHNLSAGSDKGLMHLSGAGFSSNTAFRLPLRNQPVPASCAGFQPAKPSLARVFRPLLHSDRQFRINPCLPLQLIFNQQNLITFGQSKISHLHQLHRCLTLARFYPHKMHSLTHRVNTKPHRPQLVVVRHIDLPFQFTRNVQQFYS
jgi:hypothetical protein